MGACLCSDVLSPGPHLEQGAQNVPSSKYETGDWGFEGSEKRRGQYSIIPCVQNLHSLQKEPGASDDYLRMLSLAMMAR